MKAKVELTAEALKAVIEGKKPTSMTQLAHELGYKGSVSSTLTRKFRQLCPDITTLLAKTAESATGGDEGKAEVEPKAGKAAKGKPDKDKAKPATKAEGKWKRDPRNPFRQGSAYAVCFDILAAPAHKAGLPREKLVALLAEATGKDIKRAGFDAQVLLSARGSEEPGLSRNDGPRHRSCRPGFWVRRENGHVQLVID
jgi:hypothetical protein